jgi:mannitol-1-phosphate/altronate dehydrogenase
MEVFIAPPTRESVQLAAPTPCAAFATSMWMQYRTGVDCDGLPIEITDPGALPSLQPLAADAVKAADVPTARAFVHAALGPALSESDAFVENVATTLASLKADGPRATLQGFMAERPA